MNRECRCANVFLNGWIWVTTWRGGIDWVWMWFEIVWTSSHTGSGGLCYPFHMREDAGRALWECQEWYYKSIQEAHFLCRVLKTSGNTRWTVMSLWKYSLRSQWQIIAHCTCIKHCVFSWRCTLWKYVTILRWEIRTTSSLKNVHFSVNVSRDVGRVKNHKTKNINLV